MRLSHEDLTVSTTGWAAYPPLHVSSLTPPPLPSSFYSQFWLIYPLSMLRTLIKVVYLIPHLPPQPSCSTCPPPPFLLDFYLGEVCLGSFTWASSPGRWRACWDGRPGWWGWRLSRGPWGEVANSVFCHGDIPESSGDLRDLDRARSQIQTGLSWLAYCQV